MCSSDATLGFGESSAGAAAIYEGQRRGAQGTAEDGVATDTRTVAVESLLLASRDENGMDIFRPYSKPNPFRGVEICPYPSQDIQHPIPYPYPNTQIGYL